MFSKSMNNAISSGTFFSSLGETAQTKIMIVQVLGHISPKGEVWRDCYPNAMSISYFLSKVEWSALYFL